MMFLLKSLVLLNTFVLRIGRHLAWIAIGLMHRSSIWMETCQLRLAFRILVTQMASSFDWDASNTDQTGLDVLIPSSRTWTDDIGQCGIDHQTIL